VCVPLLLLLLLLLLLQGDIVVEYMGPEPGKGTHRYALLMFEQPSFQKIEPPAKRAYFQTKQVGGWMNRWMCRWMGGRAGGRAGGWVDLSMHINMRTLSLLAW
jgi:hypothetical protein